MNHWDRPDQVLKQINAWLVVNSMRSERIQFNQLCLQNVSNIWKKQAFDVLLSRHSEMFFMDTNSSSVNAFAQSHMNVFCEKIDFSLEIENKECIPFSESLKSKADANKLFIVNESQQKILSDVLGWVEKGKYDEDAQQYLDSEMIQEQEIEQEQQVNNVLFCLF